MQLLDNRDGRGSRNLTRVDLSLKNALVPCPAIGYKTDRSCQCQATVKCLFQQNRCSGADSKMTRWILVLGALCGLLGSLQAQNYCTTSYCDPDRPNVGCNPPPLTGGPLCVGKSAAVIDLTPARQALILNEHNTRRSQFASGNLAPFAPAKRMPTLTWDAELAKQAGNNARSCDNKHDKCRNTAVYSYAGQNLATSSFYGMTKSIETLIKEGINSWWSENNVTTQAQLDKYPEGYTGPAIGHFTQMVSDQTNKIGCAMQYWINLKNNIKWDRYYLVCNYALTNIIGTPVYKKGPVGSGCTTGLNTDAGLGGLCKPAEDIKPVPNEGEAPPPQETNDYFY